MNPHLLAVTGVTNAKGSPATVDLSPLLQYGIVGFVAIVAMSVCLVLWKRELRNADEHRRRADRLEGELRRLNSTVQDQLLKALQEATSTAREVLAVVTSQDRGRKGPMR